MKIFGIDGKFLWCYVSFSLMTLFVLNKVPTLWLECRVCPLSVWSRLLFRSFLRTLCIWCTSLISESKISLSLCSSWLLSNHFIHSLSHSNIQEIFVGYSIRLGSLKGVKYKGTSYDTYTWGILFLYTYLGNPQSFQNHNLH